MKKLLFSLLILSTEQAYGQTTDSVISPPPVAKKWYEAIAIRGYVQARYNRLLETNPDLACEQCDRSWGRNSEFSCAAFG